MATSGIVKTDILDKTYFWVKWSVKTSTSSTNSTTIDWSCGVTPGRQYYTNALEIGEIKINDKIVYSGGTFSNITDYKEHTFKSGTLVIKHNDNGKKTFTISAFYGWIFESGNTWSSATDFTLPDLTVYTNCTSPTSIEFKLNNKIIKKNTNYYLVPGDMVTVSWTGAKGGTNNAITGYDVYYYFSSGNSAPTTTVYSGVSSVTKASLNITITEKHRGTYLRVGIVTKSKYNTTSLVSLDSAYKLMVNVRPNAPSVSKKSFIYKSTETQTTIKTISSGTLNFGSKTGGVYWSTSTGGAKTKVNNGQLTKGAGTYYFWTFDGKEYSSTSTVVTVSKNVQPTISSWGHWWDKTSIIKNNSKFTTTDGTTPACLEEIHFTITGNKQCYYDLIVRGGNTNITLIKKGTLSTSKITTKVFKIRELGLPLNTELTFRLTPYDDLETGEPEERNGVTSSTSNIVYKYINPSLPQYIATYNQFSDNDIGGTTARNFYQKIRVKFSYDSYFLKKGYIKLNQGTNFLNGSFSIKNDGDYIYCDFTALENLTPGKDYILSLTRQLFSQTQSLSLSYKRTPTFDPTPKAAFTINPFTDGANNENCSKDIKIQKPIYTGDFYQYFNLNENDYWKTELIVNEKSIDLSTLLQEIEFEKTTDYAVRKLQFSGSTFFDKIKTVISAETRKGEVKAILKNTVKNRFGQTLSGQAQIVTLNFNEPINISFTDNFKDHAYLYEGYKLQAEFTIITYSPNEFTVNIFLQKEGEEAFSYIKEKSLAGSPSFNSPRTIIVTLTKEIPEIKDSKTCFFSARILDGAKEIGNNFGKDDKNQSIIYKRLKCTSPVISFDTAIYSENENSNPKVEVQYNLSDIGSKRESTDDYEITRNSTLKLIIDNKTYSLRQFNVGKQTVTFDLGDSKDSKITTFKNGKLEVSTTVTYSENQKTTEGTSEDLFQKTKTGYSNIYTIYGIAPTIAYRKNSLGINTTDLEQFDILAIAPTSEKSVIELKKTGDSTTSFYIDLKTGKLLGFNIDCGEVIKS